MTSCYDGNTEFMTEWIHSNGPVAYPDAIAAMEQRVAAIRRGEQDEAVWLLEHPPLYTAGTSAKDSDLLDSRFPVYPAGRGGQYTYHGPGQRVAYVMLDLAARGGDIRHYVWQLEEWIIRTLARLDITGERRAGRIGIWVADARNGTESKIAAIGVRVRSGVTYHGIAINVHPELAHFSGIVPCGLAGFGVTSLREMGLETGLRELDRLLQDVFPSVFTPPEALRHLPKGL